MDSNNINLEKFISVLDLNKEQVKIRSQSLLDFNKKGFPSKKNEDWKFNDLNKIISSKIPNLKFFNSLISEKKDKNEIIKNISKDLIENNYIISSNGIIVDVVLNHEDKNKFEIVREPTFLNTNLNSSLNSLNMALYLDYIKLVIKENYKFIKPIVFINYTSTDIENTVLNQRFDIVMEKNSCMSILDFNLNKSNNNFYNINNKFLLHEGSVLKNYKIDINDNSNLFYSKTEIDLYKNSISENFILSKGSEFAKNDIECNLKENHSSAFVNGIVALDGLKQHEIKSKINHSSEHTKSYQLVKCSLKDQSKAAYQGKIYVDSVAQKTNGYQLSKAILLNDATEFNGKPELEIYADDVKCSHGSASGSLDENSIFYLMSRGLSYKDSRKLLINGFLVEVINQITDEPIKKLVKSLYGLKNEY